MIERERLLAALKRILKERGWRYADLAAALGVSEPTIKRTLSNGRMSLERLEQICDALDIDFFELARNARGTRESRRHLSPLQETALAAEPRLMTVFHLLCQGWRTAAIGEGYGLRKTELVRLLAQLDRLRLIELLPGDRVRLRVPRDFSWRDDGPVRARYFQMASREFIHHAFDAGGDFLALEIRELGEASAATLRRKLEKLVAEFKEAAELDVDLPPERRRSVGMLVASRPWVFSLVDSLRESAPPRRPPARG
ncbi:helix-turn-helix domain-containing protein [Lysobacter enzymogenes]|uniref:helix-turn-helix domain-containing protein n=1 Tax=Lysobacter enzymogenes TaxID=69 RepID=UPI001A95ECD4|nr:helix-turn-helix transcriptional regulator [Lysobacter enzymogenes]QQP95361.1 helix-turn-helix transcriptional regulator [Lysobacter enzymogenes]